MTLPWPPHPLLGDLWVQLSLRISALWSPMAELPTPTVPLLLLAGEQRGQAVSARRGLGPLQRGGRFQRWGAESQGLRQVVRGLGIRLSARGGLGVLCNSWGAPVGVLVG